MWMHAFAHRGCMDTARESALKVDFVRKIPRRTGESNLRQRRATLCQLSYIPIPMILYQDWKYEKAGISICASAWAKPQRSSQATLSCSFLLSSREGTLLKVPKLLTFLICRKKEVERKCYWRQTVESRGCSFISHVWWWTEWSCKWTSHLFLLPRQPPRCVCQSEAEETVQTDDLVTARAISTAPPSSVMSACTESKTEHHQK